jgi:hypothetical protein
MGGPKMLSHYIIFQGCPCLNFNMVKLEHIFSKYLHNMVDYNTKNSIVNKIIFPTLYCANSKYICDKKMYVTMY